ncbi:Non-specific serine/threonine protein kinase [Bertholletia excelsa]
MKLLTFSTFFITMYLSIILFEKSFASVPATGHIYPEFAASPNDWLDYGGSFLFSKRSNFAFGFSPDKELKTFSLVIIHTSTVTIVWTANRGSGVRGSDKFVFDKNGNAYLETEGGIAWSTNISRKRVNLIELRESGNLVFLGHDSRILWQSFSYPTDTLLSNQLFSVGMRLVSKTNSDNLSFSLEMMSGNAVAFGGFQTPQPYWSMANEVSKVINNYGVVTAASLISNSWNFYDHKKTLIWQFIFSEDASPDVIWAAVLGQDGFISFYQLNDWASASPVKIPQYECSTPEPCGPHYICDFGTKLNCHCPLELSIFPSCNPWIGSPCASTNTAAELIDMGNQFDYFALGYLSPYGNFDLKHCIDACVSNCSCVMLFFENNSGNCFLFDEIGSLQLRSHSSQFHSYIKLPRDALQRTNPSTEGKGSKKHFLISAIITSIIFVLAGCLLILLWWFRQRRKRELGSFWDVMGEDKLSNQDVTDEDNFLEKLSHIPIRFTYRDLEIATENFLVKLGQGGFGSVYKGILPDGTQVAVKKLEGIGQGKKEFRAEVTALGIIHHVHLVKLKGFCIEGSHCLMAYEYMSNGSLDKWIFRNGEDTSTLDWETRFNIIMGLAKGLAYLHEGCCFKIIHCDIKPENVLLDDNYKAKVSDFGLAKLMEREQSQTVTQLRGTRGYLAPEWVTNRAISEKSDVYSFGMVLFEIVGGRRSFNPAEDSQKAHLPSYAFKMMEEGKLKKYLIQSLILTKMMSELRK